MKMLNMGKYRGKAAMEKKKKKKSVQNQSIFMLIERDTCICRNIFELGSSNMNLKKLVNMVH